MVVQLELSPDLEKACLAKAAARGVTLDALLKEIIASSSLPEPVSKLTPEEWINGYRAWVNSHADMNLPSLSDEAISRESIYEDR